jgi:aspartyl-tRNA(Asn)/glutamyl-tRNA(Gln) amidotransferase subunit A
MLTIADIQKQMKDGATVRSIVEQALARAESAQEYNAIISVVRDRALQRADEIDAKLKAGEDAGGLAGIPFIAKDNFLTFGGKTTAASNMLKPFEAPYQSTAIERLEAQGAIVIAKANLDAYAHGGSTENSDFGPTKNPHDTTRVPGGSSGGSAAAVALNIVPFALGTDTGGSIRQPASFTGVYGMKPTYGTVSRSGVVAMASSTDTVGALANCAEDVQAVMQIIAGEDIRDSTTLQQPGLMPVTAPEKLKIGIIKEYMTDQVQPEVREAITAQAEMLRKLGHTVEEVSVPTVEVALAVYYIVVPAEISSNLSRYDGIRYGHSSEEGDLQGLYGQTRDQGFNNENKRRILIGTYVLSSGYIDAYYRKAQTVRTKLINDFAKAFEQYDLLIGPVAPTTAFKLGENTEDPLQMYLADVMTVSASLAGLPAMSVPAGKDAQNMPIGLQLIGAQRSDVLLLNVAKQLQGVSNG